MKGTHENRSDHAIARLSRWCGSVTALRRGCTTDSLRPAFHACAPRTRVQEKILGESEPQRTKAESHAFDLGPRCPRHGLLDRFRPMHLAGEFRIGQPFADNLTDANIETLRIGHLAIVEPESLLIDVAKQMEWFDADVGAVQLPLNETPEVFHAVSVDVAIRVLDRVIDDLMFEAILQAVIRPQFISEDRSARFDVLVDVLLKFFLAAPIYDHCADVPAAFQHAHNNSLILTAGPGDDTRTLALVHVASLPADEGLVDLDTVAASAEFSALLTLLSESDPVKHEPCGLLSHVQSAGNLARANAVLAIQDQPHCGQPFVQAERRFLEDGSDLHGELPLRMPRTALPTKLVLEEADLLASAGWTNDAIAPLRPTGHEVVQAVLLIREIQDRFLQAFRFSDGFHTSSVRYNRGLVKYIFALLRDHKRQS